jgi:hypothetical protein
MKTRLGFVSNSSSSSFIVAFDAIPNSPAELKKLLFDDKTAIGYYDKAITTERATYTIWDDMQSNNPLDKNQLESYIYDDYEGENKVIEDFVNKHTNAIFFEFSYADEDGPYFSVMEHGGVFDALPHLTFSHH